MPKQFAKTFTTMSILLFTLGFTDAALYAQEGYQGQGDMPPGHPPTGTPPGHPPTATPPQQQTFSNEEIQKFVQANQHLDEIRDTYSAKMQETESQEEIHAIQQEANEKMVHKVQEVGLDVQTFNAIANASSQDPNLRRKILEETQSN
jgi:hypothetical protein